VELSRSWHNSAETSKEKIDAEDRLLSDLMAHDGWIVLERMIEDQLSSLDVTIREEASSEWEVLEREGLVRTYNTLEGMFRAIKQRAERYRRKISVIR